jgi:hypothetical protein
MRLHVLLVLVSALVVACSQQPPSDDRPGDPATWYLAKKETLNGSSTSFTAVVSRFGCNDGSTGDVLPPEIEMTESEVVVTFMVSPKQTGAATCPGNSYVRFRVHLPEPLGDRSLVDGECRGEHGASTTAVCWRDETRFEH